LLDLDPGLITSYTSLYFKDKVICYYDISYKFSEPSEV
jgi:hypothetical protein